MLVASRKRMIGCSIALAMIVGLVTTLGPSAPSAGAAARTMEPEEIELWDFCKVNQRRVANDIPPLELDKSLRGSSRGWSQHMADVSQSRGQAVVFHQIPLPAGVNGENVAVRTAGDWQGLDTAWDASALHRANRMNPAFKSMGMGADYRTVGGFKFVWGTERFSTATTSDPQPDCDGVVAGRPTKPKNVDADAADNAARVSWDVPDYRGFSTISEYHVKCERKDRTRWAHSKDLRALVEGLRAGETYWCSVQAENSQGRGQWSAKDRVVPTK